MKLKNKKTGEIVYATIKVSYGGGELQIRYYPVNNAEDTHFKEYRSISELNEEWEDYEEPKEHWYVTAYGNLAKTDVMTDLHWGAEGIGNLFNTKEEAELALRKLKAWKRLKEKGFRFEWWKEADNRLQYNTIAFNSFVYNYEDREQLRKDLDLLFGGEK